MSKETGFVPIRRGILEHIRDGRLTPLEFTAHYFIASQADTRTGKWVGSAKCIASALCITERMARRVLENLSRGDYIRRFPVPGKHVCYPILVHKFYPTNGEHKGEQLDAISSLSPMDLRYVPIESGELEGEQKGEHVTSQKRIENREGIKPLPSRTVKPPSEEAVSLAVLLRGRILGNNPTARIADHQIGQWAVDADRMIRRDGRTAQQIRSLIEWSQSDAFWKTNILSMGKLREKFDQLTVKKNQPKGGTNGKDVNSAVETTMRGYAANTGIPN